jgi:hypothetical protein
MAARSIARGSIGADPDESDVERVVAEGRPSRRRKFSTPACAESDLTLSRGV